MSRKKFSTPRPNEFGHHEHGMIPGLEFIKHAKNKHVIYTDSSETAIKTLEKNPEWRNASLKKKIKMAIMENIKPEIYMGKDNKVETIVFPFPELSITLSTPKHIALYKAVKNEVLDTIE